MDTQNGTTGRRLKVNSPLQIASNGRLQHVLKQDQAKQAALGQYFTTDHTALFMASLFPDTDSPVSLLDAGAGSGILSAAFVVNICQRSVRPSSIHATAVEKDRSLLPILHDTLSRCVDWCGAAGIDFHYEIIEDDFIAYGTEQAGASGLFDQPASYTHTILNPPYGKIHSQSAHRHALRSAGVETVNLYTGFLALAAKLLQEGGELVAITPRSFCNGPYYKPFRKFFLAELALRHIHVFNSRNSAFRDDEVLQENIIFHAVKGGERRHVKITASDADYSTALMVEAALQDQPLPTHIDGEFEAWRTQFYTIRRQTMHQFVEAGFAVLNPDEPNRPVNSPFSCYQITDRALQLMRQYGSPDWDSALAAYLAEVGTLQPFFPKRI